MPRPPSRRSRDRGLPVAATSFVDDDLGHLLARASHAVSRQFYPRVRDAGLTVAEWRVLATLAETGGTPVTALAAIALLKQPTLTKLVDRLERERLVRRRGNAADRRQTVVQVTARGAARVAPLLAHATAHQRRILGDHAAAEIVSLKRTLRALIALAGGATPRPLHPPAAHPEPLQTASPDPVPVSSAPDATARSRASSVRLRSMPQR